MTPLPHEILSFITSKAELLILLPASTLSYSAFNLIPPENKCGAFASKQPDPVSEIPIHLYFEAAASGGGMAKQPGRQPGCRPRLGRGQMACLRQGGWNPAHPQSCLQIPEREQDGWLPVTLYGRRRLLGRQVIYVTANGCTWLQQIN